MCWSHGWSSVSEMLYFHGGANRVINTTVSEFIAENYQAAAFANGYGTEGWQNGNGISQEEAAIETAKRLSYINPSTKNVFYWKVDDDVQVIECSNAYATYAKHPEWKLNSLKGNNSGVHYFDTRQEEFRDFWIDHLVSLAKQVDEETRKPVLDGFFLDGLNCDELCFLPNVSHAVSMEIWNSSVQMIHDFQAELDALGYDQLAIVNSLDSADKVATHAEIASSSMVDHFGIIQFLDEETGDWLLEPMRELLFDVIRSPLNVNRTLLIKAWPGPIIHQKDIWPDNSQPKTTKGMQIAAKSLLNTALALFLLVAEETSWLSYSWFWHLGDYAPFGEDHTCPDEFYPELKCPLGQPLGPPKEVSLNNKGGYRYSREYEHATVFVDLNDKDWTFVSWHSDSPDCPTMPILHTSQSLALSSFEKKTYS